MKKWLQKNYKTIIISAFLVPIIIVAFVSISHVTGWYGITNPISWAIYLSVGIEIAALASLSALSAKMGRYAYFPFIVVTLIQFIGNIFFSYSFINVTSVSFKNWVELVSPLVSLIYGNGVDVLTHKRILAIFAGGLLPLISLSFMYMLVQFTNRIDATTEEQPPLLTEEPTETTEVIEENVNNVDLSVEEPIIGEDYVDGLLVVDDEYVPEDEIEDDIEDEIDEEVISEDDDIIIENNALEVENIAPSQVEEDIIESQQPIEIVEKKKFNTNGVSRRGLADNFGGIKWGTKQ
jgi:hypothetical protein